MIFFVFFFAYLLREKRSPVEVVGLFGEVLPAQKWTLLSFLCKYRGETKLTVRQE